MWARSRSIRARGSASSGAASAVASRAPAASNAPARSMASAACQRPASPQRCLGRQGRRPLQERGGRGEAAARLRAARRTLQLLGDRLVGTLGRASAVPRPAIRIELLVGRPSERPMGLASLRPCCGLVGGGAHQRVPEPHACADLYQTGRLRRTRRGGFDAE